MEYPISHVRNISLPPEAPVLPINPESNKVVVEAHCVVDPPPSRRLSRKTLILAGTLSGLVIYQLVVVGLVIALGTYAYNIKANNLPLESVYRTSWSLTVVIVILNLIELAGIGGSYTYLSRKILG